MKPHMQSAGAAPRSAELLGEILELMADLDLDERAWMECWRLAGARLREHDPVLFSRVLRMLSEVEHAGGAS